MKSVNWKALACAFMAATASYWFGEIFFAFVPDSDQTTSTLLIQTIFVAFLFPSTFLMVPILTGVMIDYIGVLPVLPYLNIAHIIGAGLFIPASYSQNIWLLTLASLFFGSSLILTYMATFVYICNTYITRSKNIDRFRKAFGFCICIGFTILCALVPINLFINQTASYIFGGVLILVSVGLSFSFKSGTLVQIKPASGPIEILERSDSKTRSMMNIMEAYETTFRDYNEKFGQDEINVQGLFPFMRIMGLKTILKIASLGILVGVYWASGCARIPVAFNDDDLKLSISFLVHFLGYAVFGLALSFIKWDKKRIENIIILTTVTYVVCIATIPFDLPTPISMIRYVIQTIMNAANFYVILLYLPYIIDFKLEGLGKTIGIFWWIVSIEMFASAWLNPEKSDNMLLYNLVAILPASMSAVVFIIIICLERKDQPKNLSTSLQTNA